MSDRVNWIPVAVVTSWSACVVFQAWSAINEWRKKSRYLAMVEEEAHHQSVLDNERRIVEYGRITKRGEKFNGWKWCKFPCGDLSFDNPAAILHTLPWQLIPPMWPKNGEDAPVDTSVLAFGFWRDSNANSMFYLRRYSLITPGLYDDIVQIVVDSGADSGYPSIMKCYGYIDENVVAIGDVLNDVRILLVDVNSKTYQFIETTPPFPSTPGLLNMIRTIFRYSIDGNLMVLFDVENADENASTFHLVEYEISPTDSVRSPIVRQVGSREFDWPHGKWYFTSTFRSGLSFPGVFDRMRNGADPDDSRVISLDRHGIHDYGRESEWVSKFERTRLGLRMAKSKDPLVHVVPGGGSAVDYEMHRSHLFARVRVSSTTHLVHRPISVPSLKYLAAEAYCLANQNLNLADIDWTKSIGFDISDGILEAEKPAVIRSL